MPALFAFLSSWGGTTDLKFHEPSGIAVDSSGYVYVADYAKWRVLKLDSSGNSVLTPPIMPSDQPTDVAVDSSGNIYIVCSKVCVVHQYDSSGTGINLLGTPTMPGDDNYHFNSPTGVAVDPNTDYLYVTDTGNNRVMVYDSSLVYQTQWGSFGIYDSQFNGPNYVAVDGSSNVYVTDGGNNRVQVFTSSGGYLTQCGSSGSGDGKFKGPAGVATYTGKLPIGNVYGNVLVTDVGNNRVQVFYFSFSDKGLPSMTYVTEWGSSGSGDNEFNRPVGVAISPDAEGFIAYVADTANNRIKAFRPIRGI